MNDFYDILELFIERTSDAYRKAAIKEKEMHDTTETKNTFCNKKSGVGNYSIAVKAIMESDMFDSAKSEAMRLIKKNETDAYYESIVSIAKTDMASWRKCDAIQNLNI